MADDPSASDAGWTDRADDRADDGCELCEAAPLTLWYHSDDECWIAECEACFVPMVVWRHHDPSPPDEVKARLHERLTAVATEVLGTSWWIDDRLRTIPGHYHAHARRRFG